MKYAFFKFFILIKQLKMLPVASAWGLNTLSLLTSQVDLINTEEMGKGEFYTGFVNSKVVILDTILI